MSRQFAWGESPSATQRDDRQRPLPTAQCSMCGVSHPLGLLVPDGSRACADIRWYCKDVKSCTERWTSNLPRHPHIAPTPASLVPAPVRATPACPAPPVREALSVRDAQPFRDAQPPAGERGPGPDPVAAELRSRPAPSCCPPTRPSSGPPLPCSGRPDQCRPDQCRPDPNSAIARVGPYPGQTPEL